MGNNFVRSDSNTPVITVSRVKVGKFTSTYGKLAAIDLNIINVLHLNTKLTNLQEFHT